MGILLDTCKPLFDLVSGRQSGADDTSPSPNSSMKPADLLMNVAKLIIAAGFKMKEQARQDMAEEDLGGGIFDHDVVEMREAAASYALPQEYSAEERQQLDDAKAAFDAPTSFKKYKTGTKLYKAEVTDAGKDVFVRMEFEVRAPVEQVLAYYMGHALQFGNFGLIEELSGKVLERLSAHNNVGSLLIPMPHPFQDRRALWRALWEKLDDDTYFYTQSSCVHPQYPPAAGIVDLDTQRILKLTKIGPSLTKYEMFARTDLVGNVPSRLNQIITIPFAARTPMDVIGYFASVRPADSYNEGDGEVLGQLLFYELYKLRQNDQELRDKITDKIRTMDVLRSVQAKYR
jgi:hypothetical protein